jgi:tetraprenyl-beta-curcumene synthase
MMGGLKVAIPIKDAKLKPHITESMKQDSRGKILWHFIVHTLPGVQTLLNQWKRQAASCSDVQLYKQAVASLQTKAFHCQGGAVFAVPYKAQEDVLLRLIVAYQTICDYLDNLCDRAGCTDGNAFLQLHQALIDALSPGSKPVDYYQYYPFKNDGGYLEKLVNECRLCVEKLPAFHMVHEAVINLADDYIQLQVKKHIEWDKREKVLIKWAEKHIIDYPGLKWQEFSAACGSTLGLFALLGLASEERVEQQEVQNTVRAYFPWICGLHILLDYLIDQAEDRAGKDLNFTFYYANQEELVKRLKLFVAKSHTHAKKLSHPVFGRTVVEGLLAMYLSDKKVKQQGFKKIAYELINQSGPGAWRTYQLCSVVRKFL